MQRSFSSIFKDVLIPAILFLIFLFLDSHITSVGIKNGGAEGDPIVLWLWSILNNVKWMLPFLWYIFAVLVAVLSCKYISRQFGLAWLYSIALGHLFGFLSWTRFDILHSISKIIILNSIVILFLAAAVFGTIASIIHVIVNRK